MGDEPLPVVEGASFLVPESWLDCGKDTAKDRVDLPVSQNNLIQTPFIQNLQPFRSDQAFLKG